ncbi:hypothetical protein FACS189425_00400 [Clostridia bacterium]|nr:hypothetical protein FACS189425_00400 [Clostridia bacterium]
MTKLSRSIYLDILRILSVFCVIILHVSGNQIGQILSGTFNWQTLNAYNGLTRFCVPMFVMISGALFLAPSRDVPIKTLYSKYIKRIAIAYIFWAIFYAALTCKLDLSAFIHTALYGNYHLWFAPMIIGLYMAIPVLRKITAEKKICEYFLLITFLFSILQPTIFLIVPQTAALISNYTWNSQFWVIGYVFYFLLGHYLHEYRLSRKTNITLIILGLFAWFIIIFAKHPITEWFDPYLLNTMLATITFYIIIRQICDKHTVSEKLSSNIIKLSSYTFGIYLIHDAFNVLFAHFGINALTYNPIWFIPTLSIANFTCSFAIIWLLGRIPIAKKYLM